jgi:hypothetical protein
VALDDVLDDALGSASEDLIAVLACTSSPCSCHPCTWRGSRQTWFQTSVLGLANA